MNNLSMLLKRFSNERSQQEPLAARFDKRNVASRLWQ